MKFSFLLVTSLWLYSSASFGQELAQMPCVNSENTIERNRCFEVEVASVEKQLAIEVKRVGRVLRNRDKEAPMFQLARTFMTAQEKWQSFREAECTFRSRTYGHGTGAASEAMWCEVEHGRARMEHLKGIR